MAKDKFSDLTADVSEFFENRLEEFAFPFKITFQYQAVEGMKQLIKLSKIPDHYSVILDKDILVQVNPVYFDDIKDEDVRNILFDKEIDKIQTNGEKGTFTLGTPNFNANKGFIEKYSFDEVLRAVEIEKEQGDKKIIKDDETESITKTFKKNKFRKNG